MLHIPALDTHTTYVIGANIIGGDDYQTITKLEAADCRDETNRPPCPRTEKAIDPRRCGRERGGEGCAGKERQQTPQRRG